MTSTQEIRDWLDQLNELVAEGTPGPWAASVESDGVWIQAADGEWPAEVFGDRRQADAALIVAAVNALPQLSTAVRTMANFADVLDESGDPGPVVSHQIRKYLAQALMDEEMSR